MHPRKENVQRIRWVGLENERHVLEALGGSFSCFCGHDFSLLGRKRLSGTDIALHISTINASEFG